MKRIEYWPAIILAVLLGYIGIQEFYLGNIVRGILGIFFAWTFIPAIVALVQVCKWLFKGKEWFESKYNVDSNTQKPLLS